MISISLIIPVYNVDSFLPECLDSILAQSFTDWEAVCVDDGSTDGSGKILDRYADIDSRIKVIHTKNGGYGRAMNIGMEAAQGEYIGIVESDDSILPDFCETLYRAVSENDLDIVKSECYFYWNKEDYRYRFHSGMQDRYYGTVLSKDRSWLRCQFFMNTWSGLYRRSFLKKYGIKHHESSGASYQDNGFWLQGMLLADKVLFLDYAGYLYRQDNEAASIKDERKVYAMSDEYEWLGEILKGRVSAEEMDVANTFRLYRGYWNLFRIADERKREFCDRLISDYNKYGRVFFRDTEWQERFIKIKEEPDAFCERIVENKRQVRERIENASSIVIYGAGQRGEMLFRIMCNYGWIGKLRCFVETVVPKRERIGRIPVYKLDDAVPDIQDALVIISASDSSAMSVAMIKETESRGIGNIMSSNHIIDNYYLVC